MCSEIRSINPTNSVFCYRMSPYDCYALKKGICSLYISNDHAEKISEQETAQSRESSVMYCRNLANDLLDNDYFQNKAFQNEMFSIRIKKNDCGHYEFTDGQHRTCIAKHLHISSMYVNLEENNQSNRSICSACRLKSRKEEEKRKLRYKLLSLIGKKNIEEIPPCFIDNEYMEFLQHLDN